MMAKVASESPAVTQSEGGDGEEGRAGDEEKREPKGNQKKVT